MYLDVGVLCDYPPSLTDPLERLRREEVVVPNHPSVLAAGRLSPDPAPPAGGIHWTTTL
jgi:hypothetical protein